MLRLLIGGSSIQTPPIFGNDFAGGKVFPLPEVVVVPVSFTLVAELVAISDVFLACAFQCVQARKMGEIVDLSVIYGNI